jgi:hypothetical protein
MRYIVAFLTFWYDFITGDDWTIGTTNPIPLAAAAAVGSL